MAFEISLVMACLPALGALGIEWKSVKKVATSDEEEMREIMKGKNFEDRRNFKGFRL